MKAWKKKNSVSLSPAGERVGERANLLLLCALLLVGCDPGFRPETLIENMRLIGVSAEPPKLLPGESTRVSALILDPSRSSPSTVLWLGCEADPFNLNRSPCANPDVLQDPSALTAGTGTLPPGVTVIGLNDRAFYTVPADLFGVLAPDDPRRQKGTVGQLIAFAVAETVSPQAPTEELQALFERVQRKELKSIIALFRVSISESPDRNANPLVDSLVVANEPWPKGARFFVKEGEPVTLDMIAPDSSFEPFELDTPTGVEMKTERIMTAWYSTSGRFSETSTALREGVKTIFTAPGKTAADPVPERRTGTLYTVFRDTRGGQAWREWPFYVCDTSLAAPSVTSVDWPANEGDPVVLRGSELTSVLDVIVDGVALERAAFLEASGTYQGSLPAGIPVGSPRGLLHTRLCTRAPLL
jgi:hypothetical protein